MSGSLNKYHELDQLKDKLLFSSLEILNEPAFAEIKERLLLLKREFVGLEDDPLILIYVDQEKLRKLLFVSALYYTQVCLEEIERCQVLKAQAIKNKETLEKPPLNDQLEHTLDMTSWLQGRGQPHPWNAPQKTQHELDYAVDYRAILSLQKKHLYIFESFYKGFQEKERPTNRNKVIITVLTALGGITLGFLAGFALGSIGGPIAAIISGILGVIGGVTGGIIGFSLVKTPKSNDYLHNMYMQGKETFVNLNAEDKPDLNYVIGELASCDRGRKILKYHEKFGYF